MSMTTHDPLPDEHAPTPPDAALEDAADHAGPGEVAARPGRMRLLAPWVLLVLAAGWAVFATLQWLPLAAEQRAQRDIETTSINFLTALTNWDAGDGLDTALDEVVGYGTGGFVEEANALFAGPFGQSLENIGARSSGEVEDLFVQRIEDGEAVVFGIVRQTLTNAVTGDDDVVFRGVRVFLQDVDGDWLVSSVELLGPDLGETLPAEGTP